MFKQGESENEFLFSVIIPVYNTEKYVEESINSIINQTIGFKDNIQLILIDDGSTDNSGEICAKYKSLYPDNIIYERINHAGVSTARNVGLEIASGTYINIFDSDDYWDTNSFYLAKQFFESDKGKDIDVVSFKLFMLKNKNGYHVLNFKYSENKIIDLKKDYDHVQLMIMNCFIRASSIGDIRYDTEISYMEDALFINQILLKTCKYAVISESACYKRDRVDWSNLSNYRLKKSKERYLITPKRVYKILFDISKKQYGKVERFIQYTIAYEIQWRISEKLPDSMSADEIERYRTFLVDTLSIIEDVVIANQKNITLEQKYYLYRLKYGDEYQKKVKLSNNSWYINSIPLLHLENFRGITFRILEKRDNVLQLTAVTFLGSLGIPFKLYAKDENGIKHEPIITRYPALDVLSFDGEYVVKGQLYEFALPVETNKYSFFVKFEGKKAIRTYPTFGYLGKLDHNINNSYWRSHDKIIKLIDGKINCYNYNNKMHFVSELRLLRELHRSEYNDKWEKIKLRLRYYITKLFHRNKEIWLLFDRTVAATDSAAALFKYISGLNNKKIDLYLVLSKDSTNYSEMHKYGKTIDPSSSRFGGIYLAADKVISTFADERVTQPFRGQVHCLFGLLNHEFVYLQNGILQRNLSLSLNYINKNIKLITTSSILETENILRGSYGYSSEVIKMVGMPRLDWYKEYTPKKIIAFLPVGRDFFSGNIFDEGVSDIYLKDFKHTYYYAFYNSLINNDRLHEAIKEYGYSANFYLHPFFEKQANDFQKNDCISFHSKITDYRTIIGESSLLVTDYSGFLYDFAYCGKPVIHTIFDDHYSCYSNEMYVDYETNGFGPVTKTVDETVDAIIQLLKNGCKMDAEYKRRAEEFFCYNDYDNCKRVYDAILQLEN